MNNKTINQWLRESVDFLDFKKNPSARLDCLIILEHVLRLDRSKILAQLDQTISSQDILLLNKKLMQRSLGKPIAYITNKINFFTHDFYIDERALIPRPESELIVEFAIKIINELQDKQAVINKQIISSEINSSGLKNLKNHTEIPAINVVDIGCGSGVIGLSVTLNTTNTVVDLIDISKKALEVSRINVDKYATKNRLIQSNLLEGTTKKYDLILANLPYIPLGYKVSASTIYEPYNALYAVDGGLFYYKRLFNYLVNVVNYPLYIIIEKMPELDNKLELFLAKLPVSLLKTSSYVNLYLVSA